MMRCLRLLGHKWDKWSREIGAEKTESDGRKVRPVMLLRTCQYCDFQQHYWLPTLEIVEEEKEKEDEGD